MRDTRYLERAPRAHGSYAAAVMRLIETLRYCCADDCGDIDPDGVVKDLAIIIGHIRTAPNCPECGFHADLSPVESACLNAIIRYEGSKNSWLLDDLSVRVFVADGRDLERVANPLAVYAFYLRGRILQVVEARTDGRYANPDPALLN